MWTPLLRQVMASVALALTVAVPIAAQVPWRTDVAAARREGLQRNQPILLDFWASWCGPCNTMDAEVFSQERVALALRKAWVIRVDIDRHTDIARRYEVEATPTLIVTDGHGNELFRHRGLLSADQLVKIMAAVPADLSRINTLATAVDRDKSDAVALQALGDELRRYELYIASSEWYRRGLRTRAGRDRTALRAAMLLALGRNQAALSLMTEAEKTLSQLLKEFPTHPETDAIRREIDAARKWG